MADDVRLHLFIFQATKLTEKLLAAGRDLDLFLVLVDLIKKGIDRLERSCTALQGSQVEGFCGLPGKSFRRDTMSKAPSTAASKLRR